MTAPKLTPEQRVELAATLGEAAYVQALEAERDSHKAMLQELHGHVAAMCERLGVDPAEVPADSWTLRDRILAIIAERDALQKRVAELETPAPAQEPSDTDPRDPAWWTCKQFQARFEAERARAAHGEACAKWVREHGPRAATILQEHADRWSDTITRRKDTESERASNALRALLKDEET